MEFVAAGAMKALLPKLRELVKDEYNLGKRVRKGVRSLETELTMMHAALCKVAEVPPDQLDEQVRTWAAKVRELSYDMEDAVDAFMVGREHGEPTANLKSRVKRLVKKTTKLFSKGKALHRVADAIKEAQDLAEQLAALRQRYGLELQDSSSSGATIDPRLTALYSEVTELVGIDHARDELIKMLTQGDHDASKQQLKIISIVGFGGLGKTTIAKAVYENIKVQFDCGAFVSVSQNPDITKIFKKMLHQLDKVKYANINEATRDETQLIDELREFLWNKRYASPNANRSFFFSREHQVIEFVHACMHLFSTVLVFDYRFTVLIQIPRVCSSLFARRYTLI